MSACNSPFIIGRSFRVPGLGVLVLPTRVPDWLASHPIHTALTCRLHCPNQPPLPLIATVEELEYDLQITARALLLDVDPAQAILTQSWLSLETAISNELS